MDITKKLIDEFNLKPFQAENAIKLIDEGNTIPFIARYRKEATGTMDDQLLRDFADRLEYLRNLEAQKEKIFNTISEQGAMTELIEKSLSEAMTLTELEDIYRPFKPKRKTRASVAKEKGLEPLADFLYEQTVNSVFPEVKAEEFISEENGVLTIEDALQGARDIIAEKVSDNPEGRKRLKYVCMQNGFLSSSATGEDIGVYEMYKEFSEPLTKIPGHRILAVNRGEKEGFLKVGIDFNRDKAMNILYSINVKKGSPATEQVIEAVEDSYDRLIFPSIERDIRNDLTDNASISAIKVFASNTKQLLMQSPVKNRVTLGLDPGYRTGCKVAVVDGTGKVLDTGVIYPVPPHNKIEEAKKIVKAFIIKYGVTLIAIGNGTASHETEVFAADVIKEMNCDISYMVVSEAGASVYSASKLAAKEFPDYDVSLRSAVSIARRLQDPLAELVKIDPKAIGVGQYQHDMPQKELNSALDGVVEDCVNSVGADLNTASEQLLSHIAGINAGIASNIVAYREENGVFTNRTTLKKVAKLGPKAFEQCAGFLRVPESKNVLDNTGVHPESYKAAEQLIEMFGFSADDVKNGKIASIKEKAEQTGMSVIAEKLGIGVPTLTDIIKELTKPGRDIRDELPPPMLRNDILGMESLKPGMELKGTVRNVIDFGAFVDIGVHQDGLVHISQITDRYIKHPSEVLKVGDIVTVWVISVDVNKKRISLTMKKPN